MRERYISQDQAERLIADIINRGGTTGEILAEIHHMEAADVLTPEEADAMAAIGRTSEWERNALMIDDLARAFVDAKRAEPSKEEA